MTAASVVLVQCTAAPPPPAAGPPPLPRLRRLPARRPLRRPHLPTRRPLIPSLPPNSARAGVRVARWDRSSCGGLASTTSVSTARRHRSGGKPCGTTSPATVRRSHEQDDRHLPCPPAIPGPTPETRGKLVQASGSLMPTPLRTAPIVQKSAPRRHEITDPRIQANPNSPTVGVRSCPAPTQPQRSRSAAHPGHGVVVGLRVEPGVGAVNLAGAQRDRSVQGLGGLGVGGMGQAAAVSPVTSLQTANRRVISVR